MTHKAQADVSYTEVYRAAHILEADRAAVEILQPEDIAVVRRDRVIHAIPAPSSEVGAYFLAVPETDADRARRLLERAQKDGILDSDAGQVLPARS